MNKILIVYLDNIPYFYVWDINIFDNAEDNIDWILSEIPSIKDFDLIETILDLETYKELYYANLHNNN